MQKSIIAENVRAIINARGLKHRAVAERAGLSQKQFSALLTNRKVFKDTDVIAVARALEVTPNELFGFPSLDEPEEIEGRS